MVFIFGFVIIILFKMAKIKFSALVSEMRGKLNGSVFSKNRAGAYVRNKVTPSNPQTAAQSGARALLAQFAQGWRALTQAQRDAWSGAVSSFQTTNVFGDVVNPSGNTLYSRLNILASIAGGSAMTTPPALFAVPALSNLVVGATAAGNVLTIDFDPTAIPAGHVLEVQATPQLSPGVSNANSKFATIGVLAVGFESGDSISTEYVAKYGSLQAGKKVFVRTRFIHIASGQVSQKISGSAIIA
jgi:hypothetical protein